VTTSRIPCVTVPESNLAPFSALFCDLLVKRMDFFIPKRLSVLITSTKSPQMNNIIRKIMNTVGFKDFIYLRIKKKVSKRKTIFAKLGYDFTAIVYHEIIHVLLFGNHIVSN